MDLTAGENDLGTATLLALVGGFLDAFAYVGHGKVFANALTGNIALMGVSMGQDNWPQAFAHLPPIGGFVLAILTYHLVNITSPMNEARRSLAAVISIFLEIACITCAVLGRERAVNVEQVFMSTDGLRSGGMTGASPTLMGEIV